MQVVVVEDDPTLGKLYAKILKLEGYHAEILTEEEGAYEVIRTLQPQIVIMDVHLQTPEGGISVVRQLRADPATQAIPVLLCCGSPDFLRTEGAMLAELHAELVLKPVEPATLLQMVARLARHAAS